MALMRFLNLLDWRRALDPRYYNGVLVRSETVTQRSRNGEVVVAALGGKTTTGTLDQLH
jgi:hypothetical protein